MTSLPHRLPREAGAVYPGVPRRVLITLVLLIALSAAACTGATACGQVANPDGWAGGVVVDGVIYTGSMDGTLLALDADSGQSIWEFDGLVGEDRRHAFYGDPVVVGDIVYAAGYDGHLYAVSRLDGSKIWDVPVGESREQLVGGPGHGDGIVVVGSSDGSVYAFAADNGSELWTFETGSMVWTTPLVDEGIVFFGSLDKNIYALSLKGGSELWRFKARGAVTAPPAKLGERLFVGAFDGTFYALDANSGSELWTFEGADGWYWARALVTDHAVFAAALDGNVYALSPDTGALLWVMETNGPIIGSPATVGDFLIVASDDGRLRTANLIGGGGQRECHINERLRTNVVGYGDRVYLGAWDHTVRSIAVNDVNGVGTLDEGWVYKTDRTQAENPVSDDPSWQQRC